MTIRTMTYACGCRTIGMFAAPATAWEAHAYIEMLLRYDYYAYLHEVARQAEGDGE